MRAFALSALPLALTTAGLALASPIEQLEVQNLYYKTIPTGAYANYISFSASVSGIYTTCTHDGSILGDVWYNCDDNRVQFRFDKDSGNIYLQSRLDGSCLSGQSSFTASASGDGWGSSGSIGIQLSEQGGFC